MSPPAVHPAAIAADALLSDCDVRRLRRRGPGGQHRNKVETAVVLEHRPTGVSAEANERRSQAENRAVALRRLRVNLALGIRLARDFDDPPSRLWQSRCRGGRIEINDHHADFPAMLAEALDAIAAADVDVKRAAESLGCSTSQLVRLLKKAQPALALVNHWRGKRELHPLR